MRQENILILLVIFSLPFKQQRYQSRDQCVFNTKLFLLNKQLLLKALKWYLFEKLNAKNIEKSDKLQNKIELAAPRYKGLDFSVVVYYSRVQPRYYEPLYDEFLDVTNHYEIIVKYMKKNLDKTKPHYIANKSVGLLILNS